MFNYSLRLEIEISRRASFLSELWPNFHYISLHFETIPTTILFWTPVTSRNHANNYPPYIQWSNSPFPFIPQAHRPSLDQINHSNSCPKTSTISSVGIPQSSSPKPRNLSHFPYPSNIPLPSHSFILGEAYGKRRLGHLVDAPDVGLWMMSDRKCS